MCTTRYYALAQLLRSESVRKAVGKDLDDQIKILRQERTRAQEIVDKNKVFLWGLLLSTWVHAINLGVQNYTPGQVELIDKAVGIHDAAAAKFTDFCNSSNLK